MVVAGVLPSELGATVELAMTVMLTAVPLLKPPMVCPGVMGPRAPLLACCPAC